MSTIAVSAATIGQLRGLLGDAKVSVDAIDLAEASRDSLRASRGSPLTLPRTVMPIAVVRPGDTQDASATVRFCADHDLPLVELGGGTGLMGGARSIRSGIVLDLRSMNRILDVNREDRTVRVQAGAVLADVNAALAPAGLMLGHDPWTVPIATVGGTISTNSLGYRGAQYGSMGDEVLGLQVVLGDASVLEIRPAARSSTGPRLKHLFAGAEGTLGVITEAVLRTFPIPESRRLLALDFPDFDSGFHAVEEMFAIGLVPAMIDFGQTYSVPRDTRTRFTPDGAHGRMQLAFEGYTELVRAARGRALRISGDFGARRLSSHVAREFWENRHVIAERIRQRRRDGIEDDQRADWLPAGAAFDFVHTSMPASRVLEFRNRVAELLEAWGVSIREWGLWNQPELFSVVMQHSISAPEDAITFANAVDAVLRLAQDMGGSMEYCHGAGIRLAGLMERENGRGLALLRSVKTSLDPGGILNPGKLGL
jgi:alkyldihydroxyacetonephosphate synthase